jgi:hypothetical protein
MNSHVFFVQAVRWVRTCLGCLVSSSFCFCQRCNRLDDPQSSVTCWVLYFLPIHVLESCNPAMDLLPQWARQIQFVDSHIYSARVHSFNGCAHLCCANTAGDSHPLIARYFMIMDAHTLRADIAMKSRLKTGPCRAFGRKALQTLWHLFQLRAGFGKRAGSNCYMSFFEQ